MSASRPYLLLIDDDPDDRDMFGAEFEARNPMFAVRYASNSQEALNILDDCSPATLPAVLLIDYEMPGLNGLGLLQILQAIPKYNGITKIMWSSSYLIKNSEDCKRFGASDYLIKPASNAELDNVVHRLAAVIVGLCLEPSRD